MTLGWLETLQKAYLAKNGYNPTSIEIGIQDLTDLMLDMGTTPASSGFLLNGVSVNLGPYNKGTAIFNGTWTLDLEIHYFGASPMFDSAAVRACDCGAAKCDQPGHSAWCSTQQKSVVA